MSDPKRDKPQDHKRDETKPDRPAAPLPAITAPKFAAGGPALPEVSVTSPITAPDALDERERTNTETLNPAAYAPPPDKNPDELSSDFAPASGKQLDAGGRLVAQPAPVPESQPPPARARPTPALIPTPVLAPAPAARKARPRSGDTTDPISADPPPPAAPVASQRPEPGRWILDREGQFTPESPSDVEPGAFDPTVMRAAPPPPPRRSRKRALAIAAAVVVIVAAGGGAAVWRARSQPSPAPAQEAEAAQLPRVAGDPEPARIRITSKPSGAVVHINGVSLGVTPVDRTSPFAPEAELEVEVLLKGYRPWTRRFHAGQSVSTHAQLRPAR
jgi:PEGA domain-containing protein